MIKQFQFANLFLVLAVLLFAACPNSGSDNSAGTAVKTGGAQTSGQAPATGGSTQASGWTGNAKDFTFTGFDGTSGKLSSFAGKPVVVNFWATW